MKKILSILTMILAITLYGGGAADAHEFDRVTDVPVDKVWTVTFNSDVDPTTVDGNIEIKDMSGVKQSSLVFETTENKVKVKNQENYAYDTEYEIVIEGDITDKDGREMIKGYRLKFKTVNKVEEPVIEPEPTPEPTPPTTGPEKPVVEPRKSYDVEYTYNDADYPGMVLKRSENYDDLVIEKYIGDNLVMKYITSEKEEVHGIRVGDTMKRVQEVLGKPVTGSLIYASGGGFIYPTDYTRGIEVYIKGDMVLNIKYDRIKVGEVKSIIIRDSSYVGTEFTVDTGITHDEIVPDIEKVTLDLINRQRVREGLNILQNGDKTIGIAREHTNDMMKNNFAAHTNPSGVTFADRWKAAGMMGYKGGENIMYGYPNAIEAHGWLMYSPGHRANIMNAEVTHVSIAYGFQAQSHNSYMTQVFYGR